MTNGKRQEKENRKEEDAKDSVESLDKTKDVTAIGRDLKPPKLESPSSYFPSYFLATISLSSPLACTIVVTHCKPYFEKGDIL